MLRRVPSPLRGRVRDGASRVELDVARRSTPIPNPLPRKGEGTHRARGTAIYSFGRKSTIRFALPSERSIAPGGVVSTAAVTPISALIWCARSRLQAARTAIVGAGPRLDLHRHGVEPLLAAQLDDEMRREPLVLQDQLLDLGREHVDAAHDHHVVASGR